MALREERKTRMQKSVTIHDLARRLGVSATTVSRAVNNRGRMAVETRKRILRAVSELNYQPSLVARSLIHQRTKTLGVVVPMIGNTVFTPMVQGVEQVAYKRKYNIILCNTDINLHKEQQYLQMLIQRRIEGAIIMPFAERTPDDYDHIKQLEDEGIKVVVMGQDIPVESLSRVVQDNRGDARQMTEHLVGLGHKRIGFAHLGMADWVITERERWEGYREGLQEAGIPYDDTWSFQAGQMTIEDDDSVLSGSIIDYVNRPDRPSAIFATTDMLAIKIMAIIRSLGMRIPEDIAVVGFDNILMSGYAVPPLTTVCAPAEQIGQTAAQILFNLIDNEDHSQPVHERISGELMIRESCGNKLRKGGDDMA